LGDNDLGARPTAAENTWHRARVRARTPERIADTDTRGPNRQFTAPVYAVSEVEKPIDQRPKSHLSTPGDVLSAAVTAAGVRFAVVRIYLPFIAHRSAEHQVRCIVVLIL